MKARTRVVVAALFVVPMLGMTATTQGQAPGSASDHGVSHCPPGYEQQGAGGLVLCVKEQEPRRIAGRVMLGCKGKSSCSRVPVEGVAIQTKRAGKRGGWKGGARTDEEGRYSFKRKKGVYRVRAWTGGLRIKPGAKKADLRKTGTRRANFQACGFRGSGGRASVMRPDNWETSLTCDHVIEVQWNPLGEEQVSFRWAAAPTCAGRYGPYTMAQKFWVFGGGRGSGREQYEVVDPSKGHFLDKGDDVIRIGIPAHPATGMAYQFLAELRNPRGAATGNVPRTIDGKACGFYMDRSVLHKANTRSAGVSGGRSSPTYRRSR